MVLRQISHLAAALTIFSYAAGQGANFLSSAPACAQSCGALTTAQQSCNQQNAGAPLPNIASCFCVSPDVTNLRTDPSVCADSCTSPSDQSSAVSWFANLCAAPQTITALVTGAATATQPPIGSAATTAAGAIATNTAISGNAASAVQEPTDQGSWWDQHSKWIAMVIVLVAAFTIIIILGVCLKRRHTRKQNEKNNMPSSAVWGPQQSHPSVDRLGNSNSNLDFTRDAEKGGYYQNGQNSAARDMSGALQQGSSHRSGQRGSSKRDPDGRKDGKRLKKLDKVLGR